MAGSDPPIDLPPLPREDGLPSVTPDAGEQDHPERIDDVVPTRGYHALPVVGLGGSAGSLPALREFFEAMPADSGMAFVVIVHLSPAHGSTLPEMIGRSTAMRVRAAQDGDRVEANGVYVIPPGKHLTVTDGHLRLTTLEPERGTRVAVDLFFRSLADTHGPHAMAIVLSGADGDGAIGIKRIKERGGLTVAQEPEEAEHRGMPQSAIATGMVDWILRVGEMPARLLGYRASEQRLRVPPEDGPPAARSAQASADETETALREVLAFLRARTGSDFSCYKRATIVRRISRRMQVNGVEELPTYLSYLRTHPGEAGALLQDLLISVTNFFRDREAFAALEAAIPSLFKGKGAGDPLRVWVPACATGEEAYSIAMLLMEHARRIDVAPLLQIFACDLDESAIAQARAGLYPEAITADVSEERLRRFFTKESRGYRIRREVRESVLFAAHDLLKDAPFSRVDLISCRNLLIYLDREAQKRALDIFHFALKPRGLLFLGASESVEEGSALFRPLDKKHRIYVQQPSPRLGVPVSSEPGMIARTRQAQEQARHGAVLPGRSFALSGLPPPGAETGRGDEGLPLPELHLRLAERVAPPSVLVNAEGEIVHLTANVGHYFQFAGGEPSVNVLRVIHPALRGPLRAAMFQATESGEIAVTPRVALELDGQRRVVSLRVAPARDLAPGYAVIAFDVGDDGDAAPAPPADAGSEPALRQLERENEVLKSRLRETAEQYEVSTEEQHASNEELQAMNEELRSSAEELETSREELQSVNEELSTVNHELKERVDELHRSNSDLHNLINATQIATVFLDRALRVMRYTPPAAPLFHLIPGDVGRPIAHLNQRLDYPELAADAEAVLRMLAPVERELRADARWFLARVLPYRTVEDQIAGVVLTFVDITDRKAAEEAARASEERMRIAVESARMATWQWVIARHEVHWNATHFRLLGMEPRPNPIPEDEFFRRIHPEDQGWVSERLQRAIASRTIFEARFRIITEQGAERWMHGYGQVTAEQDGEPSQASGVMMDITAQRQAELALRESEERLRLVVENARDYAIFSLSLDRRIQSWNAGAQSILGYSTEEAIGQSGDIVFTEEERAEGAPEAEAAEALANGRSSDERWHVRRDGSRFWANGVMMKMQDVEGRVIGFVKIFRDETQLLRTQEALERNRSELWAALQETERARADAEAAGKAKDHFLAVLSHELRTPLTPVQMALRMLGREPHLSEKAGEALAMIQRNVALEAQFIDGLLDITKIARGKLEIVREPVDLHEAIRRAEEVARGDAEAKGQTITLELAAEKHGMEGDISRLQQVFWNLLKNASKFTPAGGAITVRSRNEPGWGDAPDDVIVEVRDTGIGFEPEAAGRIFDAFAQASETITREFGGLGLGLAISKATVEAHGGAIYATSPGPGRGATFIVELPLSP